MARDNIAQLSRWKSTRITRNCTQLQPHPRRTSSTMFDTFSLGFFFLEFSSSPWALRVHLAAALDRPWHSKKKNSKKKSKKQRKFSIFRTQLARSSLSGQSDMEQTLFNFELNFGAASSCCWYDQQLLESELTWREKVAEVWRERKHTLETSSRRWEETAQQHNILS